MKKIQILIFIVIFVLVPSFAWAYPVSWQKDKGPYGGFVRAVLATVEGSYSAGNAKIFIGLNGRGVARSTNGGDTWTAGTVYYGIPGSMKFNPSDPTEIGMVSGTGILLSSNEGESWSKVGDSKVDNAYSLCFNSVTPEIMYAGVGGNTGYGGGVFRIDTRTPSATWEQIGFPTVQTVTTLFHDPVSGKLFASPGGIYSTSTEGSTWESLGYGSYSINCIVLASTEYSEIYIANPSTPYQLKVSTQEGRNFVDVPGYVNYISYKLDPVNGSKYAFALDRPQGDLPRRMVRTLDNGATWQPVFSGLPVDVSYLPAAILPDPSGGPPELIIAASTGFGVYASSDGGGSWHEINGQNNQPSGALCNTSVKSIAVDSGGRVYAGTTYGDQFGAPGAGIFISDTSCESWTRANENIYGTTVTYSMVIGFSGAFEVIYAATDDGVYKSFDRGATWVPVSFGLTNLNVRDLEIAGGKIYAGTFGDGVFQGVDDGGSPGVDRWVALPPMSDAAIFSLGVFSAEGGAVLYAGTQGGGIYRFHEGWTTWEVLEYPGAQGQIGAYTINALKIDPEDKNLIIAATGNSSNGLYLSTNEGTTWSHPVGPVGVLYDAYIDAAPTPNMVYVCGDGGLYRSQDLATWTNIGTGNFGSGLCIARDEGNGSFYVGTAYHGITKGIPQLDPPLAPTSFSGKVKSPTGITWSWVDNATTEYGYRFKKLLPDPGLAYLSASTARYTEEALIPNTLYTREVEAYNTPLNPPGVSGQSWEVTFAAAPSNLEISTMSIGGQHLWINWNVNGNPGGTQYIVELATSETDPFSFHDSVQAAPPYMVEGLDPMTKYWLRMYGINRKGITTEVSNVASAETLHETMPPRVFNVSFDGRPVRENDIIRATPLITANITDETISPEAAHVVSKESVHLNFGDDLGNNYYVVSGFDLDQFEFSTAEGVYKLSHKLKVPLGAGRHRFTITASDELGNIGSSDPRHVKVMSGAVAMVGPTLAHPTPFSPMRGGGEASISYTLSVDAGITIYVYDVSGKLVLTRKYGPGANGGKAGYNEIKWNGITDFGGFAPNGILVYKVISDNKVIGTGKIVVYD